LSIFIYGYAFLSKYSLDLSKLPGIISPKLCK
jgi:hypothetical protein